MTQQMYSGVAKELSSEALPVMGAVFPIYRPVLSQLFIMSCPGIVARRFVDIAE